MTGSLLDPNPENVRQQVTFVSVCQYHWDSAEIVSENIRAWLDARPGLSPEAPA